MPWTKFRIGKVSADENFQDNSCQILKKVYHITHIENGVKIFQDDLIRAGLIYDKSILNRERIQVNWLSPNSWYDGYRYGNIRFTYNFNELVKGKKYYWVESIAYGVEACRILITSKDQSHLKLKEYDPQIGDGPWFYDSKSDTHYWNGEFTLEFMFEEDLEVSNFECIDFVDHHMNFCTIDHKKCPDKDKKRNEGGGEFIARLIARNIKIGIDLNEYLNENGSIDVSMSWKSAVETLGEAICSIANPNGTIRFTDPEAQKLAKVAIICYAYNPLSSKVPINQFKDGDHLKSAILNFLSVQFKFQDYDEFNNSCKPLKRRRIAKN